MCPSCGQLVDVTYDGPRVELRPQPWRGSTWHAGCAVAAFQQEQQAIAPKRRAALWVVTAALLAVTVVAVLLPWPWRLAAILPGLAGLFSLLLVTMGPKWGREVRP
jgi:Flp pilus assembly protein TadB